MKDPSDDEDQERLTTKQSTSKSVRQVRKSLASTTGRKTKVTTCNCKCNKVKRD